jgi:hypothetical protein
VFGGVLAIVQASMLWFKSEALPTCFSESLESEITIGPLGGDG